VAIGFVKQRGGGRWRPEGSAAKGEKCKDANREIGAPGGCGLEGGATKCAVKVAAPMPVRLPSGAVNRTLENARSVPGFPLHTTFCGISEGGMGSKQ
jgi:hypothetical protein